MTKVRYFVREELVLQNEYYSQEFPLIPSVGSYVFIDSCQYNHSKIDANYFTVESISYSPAEHKHDMILVDIELIEKYM